MVSEKKKRPLAVTVLAIFIYIVGIVTVARGLEYAGVVAIGLFQDPSWAAGYELILGGFWILVGLAIMVVGTGLWRLKSSAWTITLGFTVVSLIVTAPGLPTTWIRFALYLILLIYLIAVKKHF